MRRAMLLAMVFMMFSPGAEGEGGGGNGEQEVGTDTAGRPIPGQEGVSETREDVQQGAEVSEKGQGDDLEESGGTKDNEGE